uniref:Uncharacterized protein n=1 Tax=Oryza barthii TaxID=65489 RepID=A0A0D3FTW0_9ORYZ
MDAICYWGLSHSKNVNKSSSKGRLYSKVWLCAAQLYVSASSGSYLDKEDRGEEQKRKAHGKWDGASLSKAPAPKISTFQRGGSQKLRIVHNPQTTAATHPLRSITPISSRLAPLRRFHPSSSRLALPITQQHRIPLVLDSLALAACIGAEGGGGAHRGRTGRGRQRGALLRIGGVGGTHQGGKGRQCGALGRIGGANRWKEAARFHCDDYGAHRRRVEAQRGKPSTSSQGVHGLEPLISAGIASSEGRFYGNA